MILVVIQLYPENENRVSVLITTPLTLSSPTYLAHLGTAMTAFQEGGDSFWAPPKVRANIRLLIRSSVSSVTVPCP